MSRKRKQNRDRRPSQRSTPSSPHTPSAPQWPQHNPLFDSVEHCDATILPRAMPPAENANPANHAAAENAATNPAPEPARGQAKLDALAKARICDLVALGETIKSAARLVGVGESTIHAAKRRDPQFATDLLKSREDPSQLCLQTMKRAAGDNWRAAFHYLKIVKPERFERRANMLPARQVNELLDEVLRLVRSVVTDQQMQQLAKLLPPLLGKRGLDS